MQFDLLNTRVVILSYCLTLSCWSDSNHCIEGGMHQQKTWRQRNPAPTRPLGKRHNENRGRHDNERHGNGVHNERLGMGVLAFSFFLGVVRKSILYFVSYLSVLIFGILLTWRWYENVTLLCCSDPYYDFVLCLMLMRGVQ